MKKEAKTVPKQLGQLAVGLAKIIGEIDEIKGQNQQKSPEKKEKL